MTPPLNGHGDHSAPHSPLGHVEEWESSAIDYLEARLSAVQSSAIADHLAACDPCREKLAEQKRMILVLGAVEPAEVPRDLEFRVFDRLFTAAAPVPLKHSAEQGVLRRLLTGAARRPWVPAAIAAVVVMVALAGSSDVIRFGGGADTSRSDVSAPTVAEEATPADAQTETLKSSSSSSAGASLPAAESRDAAGNAVGALDAPGTETTTPGMFQNSPLQTDAGNQGSAVTTVTTAAADSETSPGGEPAGRAAQTIAPTVWVSAEVAVGDVNAGASIEEITGLRPLAMRTTPGVPIYAAMIRRGSIDLVLRQLRNAGLAVARSDMPQPTLDSAALQGVQEIAELPYLEPVSPQGDSLSASTVSQAVGTGSEYVLMVLSAVR